MLGGGRGTCLIAGCWVDCGRHVKHMCQRHLEYCGDHYGVVRSYKQRREANLGNGVLFLHDGVLVRTTQLVIAALIKRCHFPSFSQNETGFLEFRVSGNLPTYTALRLCYAPRRYFSSLSFSKFYILLWDDFSLCSQYFVCSQESPVPIS